MIRLTKEQIKEIKESNEIYTHLAKKYNVTIPAIRYHKSEEFRTYLRDYQRERYRKMSKEQKKELVERKREYQREYHRNRYQQDPKYRKKQIEMAKKYQREKRK